MNVSKLLKSGFAIVAVLLILSGCSDTRPFIRQPEVDDPLQVGKPDERPDHADVLTFYVLGDWGTGDEKQRRVARALKRDLMSLEGKRTTTPFVLGLGDNVYPDGLHQGWNHPEVIRRLHETFGDMYSDITFADSNIVFHVIPGNHDHGGRVGGKDGVGDVIHQETTAERLYPYWEYYPVDPKLDSDTDDSTNYASLKSANIFELSIPQEIEVKTSKIKVAGIDTQAMLELYAKNDTALLSKYWQKLNTIFEHDSGWKILLGHHPIKTHGWHGGFRSAIWWVPPIIFFTITDKLFLSRIQDLDHPANQAFQRDLTQFMRQNDVYFYLSGHEHNLQLIRIGERNFQLISGASGKLSEVSHDDDTFFSHQARGFVRCDVTKDAFWLEFISIDSKTGEQTSSAMFKLGR